MKILESINTAISKCGPHNYGDYDLFSDLDILVQYLLNWNIKKSSLVKKWSKNILRIRIIEKEESYMGDMFA